MADTDTFPADTSQGSYAGDDAQPAKPLKNGTTKAKAAAKVVVDEAGKAKSTIGATVRDSASNLTKQATDKARAYADEGKAMAGGALDEFSKLLTEAAGSVDDRLGQEYGKYARSAAGAVSNFSEGIKAKNIDELIDDARALVKKSPVIAIGTAAAVGFALVRLVKAGLDAAEEESDRT